ncbi:integrin, partial [Myxococcota bacterium]|nr:integrin [Myxococcota bacterium]
RDSGAVYVFKRTDTTWAQEAYIKLDTALKDANFGYSVAVDGDTLVGGAYDAESAMGLVAVFTRSGTTWTQEAVITPAVRDASDRFGNPVRILGDTLAIGAISEDSSATGINSGGENDNGAVGSGAVYVYTRSATVWTQEAYIKASNTGADDFFGLGLSLGENRLAVGAAGESSSATAYDGDEADNTMTDSGAVYLFTRSGTTWTQVHYLKAINTGNGDFFGREVSLSGGDLLIGARLEDSSTTGVDGGGEADNSVADSGAAYVTQPW